MDNLFQMIELESLLGDFKDDFDIDGIIDDATEVRSDGNRYWTVFGDDLNDILEKHEIATANVYLWWDGDLNGYRFDLTPVVNPERVDAIRLPNGWSVYETESGEVFATDSPMDDLDKNTYPNPWIVTHYGMGNDDTDGHYALREKFGKAVVSVKTISKGI